MRERKSLIMILICLWTGGCAAPHYFWPQKDMVTAELNPPTFEKKILIASRKSPFKEQVVSNILNHFAGAPVYFKVVGIEALDEEDAAGYSGVVILSTCLAWTMDPHVERFLEKNSGRAPCIVLTTADGADMFPDESYLRVDAMSSASVSERAGPVSRTIIGKIEKLLE